MTQLTMRSGAADRVNDGGGCSTKNFDTQLIPNLQPLVDEPGADAIVGNRDGASGRPVVRFNQIDEEPCFF